MGRSFRIGQITVHPIRQLRYLARPEVLLAGGLDDTLPQWCVEQPYVDPASGGLVLDIGGFYLETGTEKVVIDLGIGNDKARPNPAYDHRSDPWLEDLGALGCSPQDVSLVMFTHLHVDHVGYGTTLDGQRYRPTFDRARHVVAAREADYWLGSDVSAAMHRVGDYVADSVRPIFEAGLIDAVPDDAEIRPGIRLRPAHGHTPGCSVIEVESMGERAVFSGDVIHHPVLVARPDLRTNYCVDPHGAVRARRELLARVANTDVLLVPAHFAGMGPGRVAMSDGAYRYEPAAPIS